MKRIWFAAAAVLAASAGEASAADLAPSYVKAPVAAVYDWTGFYVGGSVGGGWQRSATAYSSDPSYVPLGSGLFIFALDNGILARSLAQNGSGALGGVTAGYNWQRGTVVMGVEGDWSWAGIKGTNSVALPAAFFFPLLTTTTETRTDWLATLRGRLGLLVAPQTLLFATGGLAVGEIKTSTNVVPSTGGSTCANNALCVAGSGSFIRTGWTAGAGIEQGIGNNWTVKVEYLHYDLGSVSHTVTEASPAFPLLVGAVGLKADTRVSGDIGRVGVNYRF
jgi:outer membrane immunogenic protein